MTTEYTYFVVYYYTHPNGEGHGNCVMILFNPIKDISDVREVNDRALASARRQNPGEPIEAAVVTNFILLDVHTVAAVD
jgi:hypothetical protein